MISKKMMTTTAALLAPLTLLLSGCTAAGKDAPTSKIKQVTDGVERDSGSIKLRDFVLVAQPDGSATLVGTVVNEVSSGDAITSIRANGVTAVTTGALALEKNAPVIFSGDIANAHANFPGLNLTPGRRAVVTVTFGKADSVKFSVLVREQAGVFANVA